MTTHTPFRSIFTPDELQTIKSKALYWDELVEREGGGEILRREFAELYHTLGLRLIWAVRDYARFAPVMPKLLEALTQIAERRLLVMDDQGDTAADAMVRVAQAAIQETTT